MKPDPAAREPAGRRIRAAPGAVHGEQAQAGQRGQMHHPLGLVPAEGVIERRPIPDVGDLERDAAAVLEKAHPGTLQGGVVVVTKVDEHSHE